MSSAWPKSPAARQPGSQAANDPPAELPNDPRPASQAANQSTNQPADQPADQPARPPASQPAGRPGHPCSLSAGRKTKPNTHQPNILAKKPFSSLAAPLADISVSKLNSESEPCPPRSPQKEDTCLSLLCEELGAYDDIYFENSSDRLWTLEMVNLKVDALVLSSTSGAFTCSSPISSDMLPFSAGATTACVSHYYRATSAPGGGVELLEVALLQRGPEPQAAFC